MLSLFLAPLFGYRNLFWSFTYITAKHLSQRAEIRSKLAPSAFVLVHHPISVRLSIEADTFANLRRACSICKPMYFNCASCLHIPETALRPIATAPAIHPRSPAQLRADRGICHPTSKQLTWRPIHSYIHILDCASKDPKMHSFSRRAWGLKWRKKLLGMKWWQQVIEARTACAASSQITQICGHLVQLIHKFDTSQAHSEGGKSHACLFLETRRKKCILQNQVLLRVMSIASKKLRKEAPA